MPVAADLSKGAGVIPRGNTRFDYEDEGASGDDKFGCGYAASIH